MATVKYEVDPYNRLILEKTGKGSELRYFRKVLDGRFKISKHNSLTYHVKSPVGSFRGIPNQIRFKGNWSLDKEHNLVFTLNKWKRQSLGEKLVLKGRIIDVRSNSLIFSLSTVDNDRKIAIYGIELRGIWDSDRSNRLTLSVDKGSALNDILTFKGTWDIDKNYQIVYKYQKKKLKKRKKVVRNLLFRGHWDVVDKHRISYELGKSTGSLFVFRTKYSVFKERYIKYQVAIGSKGKGRPVKRVIMLSGRWRIKKGTGLIFEVEYAGKRTNVISFGAEARLSKNGRLSFKLKDDLLTKDLGINLELSRRILRGDGQAFIRFLAEKENRSVLIGASRRW